MTAAKNDQYGPRIGFPLSFTVLFCSHMLIFAIPEEWFIAFGFNYKDWLGHLPEIVVSLIGDSVFPAATTVSFLTLPLVMVLGLGAYGKHVLFDHWNDYVVRQASFQKDKPHSHFLTICVVVSLVAPIYYWWGIPNRARFALTPWFVPWENRVAAAMGLSGLFVLFFVAGFVGLLAEIKIRVGSKQRR